MKRNIKPIPKAFSGWRYVLEGSSLAVCVAVGKIMVVYEVLRTDESTSKQMFGYKIIISTTDPCVVKMIRGMWAVSEFPSYFALLEKYYHHDPNTRIALYQIKNLWELEPFGRTAFLSISLRANRASSKRIIALHACNTGLP